MGKWKYLNWLAVIIILLHMYRYFFLQYEAPPITYILATGAWLAIAALGYYIFVYRIGQWRKHGESPAFGPKSPKAPTKERPKVVFKKKDQHSK